MRSTEFMETVETAELQLFEFSDYLDNSEIV